MTKDGKLRVVIAGGGVAALEAMVALRRLAEDHVEIELVAPDREFFYRPLATAEPFRAGEVLRFDLRALAAGCGAAVRVDALVAVEPEHRRVRTRRGALVEYDSLLIAVGARPRLALPGAVTFRGQEDTRAVEALLESLTSVAVNAVAFVVPPGVSWPLPVYELALQTGEHAEAAGADVALTIVTPEEAPLAVFGGAASAEVAELLDAWGIALRTQTYARDVRSGALDVVPGPGVSADRVVAVPVLAGIAIAGVPRDESHFIHVDRHSRVEGLDGVYAAGDGTTFPIKQGGLAAQQADAAAECIAAAAGAPIEPEPFEPVLRGLLLTGAAPRFLRADLGGGKMYDSQAAVEPLWWPAAKISARYLAPYLAEHSLSAFAGWPSRASA
jgi:sulfide:quinone oxidoreductase